MYMILTNFYSIWIVEWLIGLFGVNKMINYNEKDAIIAKITSKNQITIPKSIRNVLDITSHDHIVFKTNELGQVIIKGVDKKQDFWERVEEQQAKYGPIDDGEINWGEDIEVEDFD